MKHNSTRSVCSRCKTRKILSLLMIKKPMKSKKLAEPEVELELTTSVNLYDLRVDVEAMVKGMPGAKASTLSVKLGETKSARSLWLPGNV